MYTLDPQDVEEMESDNNLQRLRMKKYLRAVVDEALTERQRQVIKMYYGDGKKTPEIALQLGISPRVAQHVLGAVNKKLEHYKKIFFKSDPQ